MVPLIIFSSHYFGIANANSIANAQCERTLTLLVITILNRMGYFFIFVQFCKKLAKMIGWCLDKESFAMAYPSVNARLDYLSQ